MLHLLLLLNISRNILNGRNSLVMGGIWLHQSREQLLRWNIRLLYHCKILNAVASVKDGRDKKAESRVHTCKFESLGWGV